MRQETSTIPDDNRNIPKEDSTESYYEITVNPRKTNTAALNSDIFKGCDHEIANDRLRYIWDRLSKNLEYAKQIRKADEGIKHEYAAQFNKHDYIYDNNLKAIDRLVGDLFAYIEYILKQVRNSGESRSSKAQSAASIFTKTLVNLSERLKEHNIENILNARLEKEFGVKETSRATQMDLFNAILLYTLPQGSRIDITSDPGHTTPVISLINPTEDTLKKRTEELEKVKNDKQRKSDPSSALATGKAIDNMFKGTKPASAAEQSPPVQKKGTLFAQGIAKQEDLKKAAEEAAQKEKQAQYEKSLRILLNPATANEPVKNAPPAKSQNQPTLTDRIKTTLNKPVNPNNSVLKVAKGIGLVAAATTAFALASTKYESDTQQTDTTTLADTKNQPESQTVRSQNDKTDVQAKNATFKEGVYCVDSDYSNFRIYKETYFKNSPFGKTLEQAARYTEIMLEGNETPDQAKLKLYRAFVQNGLGRSTPDTAVYNFFKTLSQHLTKIGNGLEAGTINPSTSATFKGPYSKVSPEMVETYLLYNSLSAPVAAREYDESKLYTVETDPKKNLALAEFDFQTAKTAKAFNNLVHRALESLKSAPCQRMDLGTIKDCFYTKLIALAEDSQKPGIENGSVSLAKTFKKMDYNGQSTVVSRILEDIVEMPKTKPALQQKTEKVESQPACTTKDCHPATYPKAAPTFTPAPAPAVRPAPAKAPATPTTPATPKNTTEKKLDPAVRPAPCTRAIPCKRASAEPQRPNLFTKFFEEVENKFFKEGKKIDQKNIAEAKKEQQWVDAYPTWYPEQPKTPAPSLYTRVSTAIKNYLSPTPEQIQQEKLKKQITKSGFFGTIKDFLIG